MPTARVVSHGSFSKTFSFLNRVRRTDYIVKVLQECGKLGVESLKANTPKNTGLTSESWYYEVEDDGRHAKITWYNSNVASGGFPVAIMLQYGHGTGTGGYVQGIDYINPAMKPIFDKIVDTVWKAVQDS